MRELHAAYIEELLVQDDENYECKYNVEYVAGYADAKVGRAAKISEDGVQLGTSYRSEEQTLGPAKGGRGVETIFLTEEEPPLDPEAEGIITPIGVCCALV